MSAKIKLLSLILIVFVLLSAVFVACGSGKVKIEYDLDGGVNAKGNPTEYDKKSGNFKLLEPTKEYFDFLGWFDDEGNKVEELTPVYANKLRLTAKWQYYLAYEGTMVTGFAAGANANYSEVVIPSAISTEDGEIEITHIDDAAFKNNKKIQTLKIGDSVKSIGQSAFEGCSSLTNIDFGNGLENIYSYAFSGCDKLMTVTIPQSVKEIDSGAFNDCFKLVEVINKSALNISTGAEDNGDVAFYAITVHNQQNSKLRKSAENYLFVRLDDANYLVGYDGDDNATKLTLPVSNEPYYVNKYAFYQDETLTSVKIPADSALEIGQGAFKNCVNLRTADIKSSSKIGDEAFYGCVSLYNLTLSENLREIGESAFYGCYSLTSVSVPQSMETIGDAAFKECYKLVEVINKSNLTIEKNIDNGWIGFFSIVIHNQQSKLVYQSNFVFLPTEQANYLVCYDGESPITLNLPENYKNQEYVINDFAFFGCKTLTKVTIPSGGAKKIGKNAFTNCSKLAILKIGDSVTEIDQNAFFGCRALISVTLGASVTEIRQQAFYGCSKLIQVINLSTLPLVEGSTDYGNICQNAKFLLTTENENKIREEGDYLFASVRESGNAKLCLVGYIGASTDLILPSYYNGAKYEIYKNAFAGDGLITSVVISAGVTNIGESAFANCFNLKTVTIQNGVEEIGWNAFKGCDKLEKIVIAETVSTIGFNAFDGCTALTEAVFKEPVGWTYSLSSEIATIPSKELANAKTAAELLKTQSYRGWQRLGEPEESTDD